MGRQVIAGLCAATLVWCALSRKRSDGTGDSRDIYQRQNDTDNEYGVATNSSVVEASGTVSSALAAACASVRAGATPCEAFEQQAGRRFAAPDLTCDRIFDALERSAAADSAEHRHAAAHRVMVACALSQDAGCSPVDALEAVRAGFVRDEEVQSARSAALAVPRATVRLLAVLPVFIVLAGTVMSSHPIRFLLGNPLGWLCLAGGALLEACGVLWMRHSIDRFLSSTSALATECGSPHPWPCDCPHG